MHPGDQHNTPGADLNPFEEKAVSKYTAAEIATLQAKLDQQLGPEFLSSRPGAGNSKVHYIQADKCINLANEVFGFNGWSSSIKHVEVDFLDQNKEGKWSVGISVTVRVTLKDGTFHEDVGYGSMENGKNKAQVFEKAKKEGTTDGLKRALRNFGNVLGNCIYDKDYLSKITRVKSARMPFDEKRLHRHADRHADKPPVMMKPQAIDNTKSTALDASNTFAPTDEYGGDEFDELGIFDGTGQYDDLMPDEVTLDIKSVNRAPTTINTSDFCSTISRNFETPTHGGSQKIAPLPQPPINIPRTLPSVRSRLENCGANAKSAITPGGPSVHGVLTPSRPQQSPTPHRITNALNNRNLASRGQNEQQLTDTAVPTLNPPKTQGRGSMNPPIGFYTGRAALDKDGNIPIDPERFDPHRQTTIPRSAGVDHSTSSPVHKRKLAQVPAARTNFDNPSLNVNRQIGLPPSRTAGYRSPLPKSTLQSLAGTKRVVDGESAYSGYA
ncbi:hypothetical protein EDC01DRAFT_622927 [Geopyxis carbonaria]|nr:hypothetical protein EDC01DRAFT_622927 [Geopyxis carbonaria]